MINSYNSQLFLTYIYVSAMTTLLLVFGKSEQWTYYQ